MRQTPVLFVVLLTLTAASGQEPQPRQPDRPKVERSLVRSASRFVDDQVRIVGRVTVLDAHTLRYEDGTEVDLLGASDAPDLEQLARIGDDLYPAGWQAADFLRALIADRPVTCFLPTDRDDWDRQMKFRQGRAFMGETSLNDELVRNGWATAHHTGMQSWEALARLNKRGLWQGEFVFPEKWRKGERLTGEDAAGARGAVAVGKALAALWPLEPVVKLDQTRPGKPVVAVHFLPNFGKVTDDHLAHLKAFPHLRSVEVPNKPFVTDAGLAHLAELDQLEEVVLNGTGVTAEAVVRFLKGRTRLQRLSLMKVPLRDDDLAALKHLTELRELSLRETSVTDQGAAHLTAFTKLSSLNLATREGLITDAALPHLKNLTDLEDLDLDRTGITDAGLAHLKPLQKLRRLQFAFTKVGDAGLEHLHALPNLKDVNARGTEVTKSGVDRLKERLPDVRVGFGPAVK